MQQNALDFGSLPLHPGYGYGDNVKLSLTTFSAYPLIRNFLFRRAYTPGRW